MVALLLLFLTIPAVFAADPKCPADFKYFKRAPTDKNNHTSDWCLGIIEYKDSGNRDVARSICASIYATVSIPENQNELDVISADVMSRKLKYHHTIDGQISPKCMAEYRRDGVQFNETKGECNIYNRLISFDDVHTDPAFVLKMLPLKPTDSFSDHGSPPAPVLKYYPSCLSIWSSHIWTYKEKSENVSASIDMSWCNGAQSTNINMISRLDTVLCGRAPL